jgi:hypothetical protein
MYALGLLQVYSDVRMQVYNDAPGQVNYVELVQVYLADNDDLQASPIPFRLHKGAMPGSAGAGWPSTPGHPGRTASAPRIGKKVNIPGQSRKLYGWWPLKGA